MAIKKLKIIPLLSLLFLLMVQSCYKKEIDFGTVPETGYTNLVYVDTVAVQLSTVVADSFETNGATSLLLGKYKDPYLGIVSAKPFFQISSPAEIPDIPVTAVFDSLVFIIRTNHYYYGDTSRFQTINVNELAQPVIYSYNDKIYNTSQVAIKPVPLGTKTMKISPSATDSIVIRLDNTKGTELFDKLVQKDNDVKLAANFLNYFKGISLSVNGNDTTAIYGLAGTTNMVMRLIYHHTTPAIENKYVDFPFLANDLVFNQVLADRTGTTLAGISGSPGVKEISSLLTGNHAFSQYGTGILLKLTFPSLKGVIKTDNIVKLVKAELIFRPAALSFDRYRYMLPSSMYMLQTDGSNTGGAQVLDSTGLNTAYGLPVIDEVYGENTYYRFNVTAYINRMLNTAGSEDDGFFLLENAGPSNMQVNRIIMNDAYQSKYKSQLLLSLLIINK